MRRGEELVDAIGSALVAVAPYFSMYSRYAAQFRRNSAQFGPIQQIGAVLSEPAATSSSSSGTAPTSPALAILEKKCKFCTQGARL